MPEAKPKLPTLVITQSELDHFGLQKCRRNAFLLNQQIFDHFMRPSNAFRRYNGCRIMAILGLTLIGLGVFLYSRTRTTLMYVPYATDSAQEQIFFRVKTQLKGPFPVYVFLDRFYGNVRAYMDGLPENLLSNKQTCAGFRSNAEVFTLRPPESFPELGGDPDGVFTPCGIQSATFFNDEFALSLCPKNCAEEDGPRCCAAGSGSVDLPLSTEDIAPSDWLLHFAHEPKPDAWTSVLSNTRLQAWYFKPMMNSRLILIGVLRSYYLDPGLYMATVTKNVFPDEKWGLHKFLVIASFGGMGSKQPFLLGITFITGSVLILLSLIFYWAIKRNIVFSTATTARVPAEEIRSQWISHVEGWRNSGFASG